MQAISGAATAIAALALCLLAACSQAPAAVTTTAPELTVVTTAPPQTLVAIATPPQLTAAPATTGEPLPTMPTVAEPPQPTVAAPEPPQPSADSAPTTVPQPTAEAATAVPQTLVPAPTPLIPGQWSPPPRTKTAGCVSQAGLPDPACTPGAVDQRVNQADLRSSICTSGYTAKVRPPARVTERIKVEQMAAYGLTGQPLADFELDHLISLELGGAPADVANLWPEPWTGPTSAHEKDAVENFLNREVCRGALALSEAQRQIATDWLAVYRGRGLRPAP